MGYHKADQAQARKRLWTFPRREWNKIQGVAFIKAYIKSEQEASGEQQAGSCQHNPVKVASSALRDLGLFHFLPEGEQE